MPGKAPYSPLAKKILDNPESAQQLRDWLTSGNRSTTLTVTDEKGRTTAIDARRREPTPHPVLPPKRGVLGRIRRFWLELMLSIVDP